MPTRTGYDRFAPFYDAVMGERPEAQAMVRRLARDHAPRAVSVLDLACGTGTMLKGLSSRYEVSGLDISSAMLAIARKKVPGGQFFRQDMTRFRLPGRYDVILCIFDAINHVTTFGGWNQIFRRARAHLKASGLFVFDINTERRLCELSAQTPWFAEFDGSYLILKVTERRGGLFHWSIKVLENRGGTRFNLAETTIAERSFPVTRIVRALRKHFSKVETYVGEGAGTKPSARVYFACQCKS